MSLCQRIVPIAEMPFPFIASAVCQQVPSKELQTDPHAVRKRYDARSRRVGSLDPYEKMQTYNKKPDTGAFRSVSK